jgi:hypothetical protein
MKSSACEVNELGVRVGPSKWAVELVINDNGSVEADVMDGLCNDFAPYQVERFEVLEPNAWSDDVFVPMLLGALAAHLIHRGLHQRIGSFCSTCVNETGASVPQSRWDDVEAALRDFKKRDFAVAAKAMGLMPR